MLDFSSDSVSPAAFMRPSRGKETRPSGSTVARRRRSGAPMTDISTTSPKARRYSPIPARHGCARSTQTGAQNQDDLIAAIITDSPLSWKQRTVPGPSPIMILVSYHDRIRYVQSDRS